MMRILGELMETSYVTKVHLCNYQLFFFFLKKNQSYLRYTLASAIKPNADGSVDVDFTVHNATSFPISSMTGEIEFVGPEVINSSNDDR